MRIQCQRKYYFKGIASVSKTQKKPSCYLVPFFLYKREKNISNCIDSLDRFFVIYYCCLIEKQHARWVFMDRILKFKFRVSELIDDENSFFSERICLRNRDYDHEYSFFFFSLLVVFGLGKTIRTKQKHVRLFFSLNALKYDHLLHFSIVFLFFIDLSMNGNTNLSGKNVMRKYFCVCRQVINEWRIVSNRFSVGF